jgi:hypothetical protein
MAQPLVQPKLNYNTDSNESIPETRDTLTYQIVPNTNVNPSIDDRAREIDLHNDYLRAEDSQQCGLDAVLGFYKTTEDSEIFMAASDTLEIFPEYESQFPKIMRSIERYLSDSNDYWKARSNVLHYFEVIQRPNSQNNFQIPIDPESREMISLDDMVRQMYVDDPEVLIRDPYQMENLIDLVPKDERN